MIEVKQIREDEGFESKPYQDHLGNWTFGIGFTFITEEESVAVLKIRLSAILASLNAQLHWYADLPIEVKNIMLNMAYQLGVSGLLGFTKTMVLLKNERWVAAADEMLDSKWARQTPERANRLSDRLRKVCC